MQIDLINFVLRTFYSLLKINISYYDHKSSIITSYKNQIDIIGLKPLKIILNENFNEKKDIHFFTVNLYENYIISKISNYECYVCGPFTNSKPSLNQMTSFFMSNSSINRRKIIQHFNHIPYFNESYNNIIMAEIVSISKLSNDDINGLSEFNLPLDANQVNQNQTNNLSKLHNYNLDTSKIVAEDTLFENLFNSESIYEANIAISEYYINNEFFEDLIQQSVENEFMVTKSILFMSTSIAYQQALKHNLTSNKAASILLKHNILISNSNDLSQMQSMRRDILLDYYNALIKDKENNYNRLVEKVKSYISINITSKLTVTLIAKELMYNKEYISHVFKKETNIELLNYINIQKINISKELLQSTEDKIVQISKFLGYSDPANFSRLFKKYTNLTPREYRKKIK